jgi:hypothetical protein
MTHSEHVDMFCAVPALPKVETRILTSATCDPTLIDSDRNFLSQKS